MITELTRCVIAAANPPRRRAAHGPDGEPDGAAAAAWRQLAMLDSFPVIDPKRPVRRRVTLTTRPASLDVLAASERPRGRRSACRVVMQVLELAGQASSRRRAARSTETETGALRRGQGDVRRRLRPMPQARRHGPGRPRAAAGRLRVGAGRSAAADQDRPARPARPDHGERPAVGHGHAAPADAERRRRSPPR